MERKLVEDAHQKILEDGEAFAIGALRGGQGVGARKGLEEVGVLANIDAETLEGELARRNALHKGMREAGVGEIPVAQP